LQEAEKDRLNDFAFAIVIGNDISADWPHERSKIGP
jgi:hypothetical protein